jgi:hypothetical protein
MPRLAPRTAGRPRKQPAAKKRSSSVSLSPATKKKMSAVRLVHDQNKIPPASASWMVEQGLELYFQFELQRFPELAEHFSNIERPLKVIGKIEKKASTSSDLEGETTVEMDQDAQEE